MLRGDEYAVKSLPTSIYFFPIYLSINKVNSCSHSLQWRSDNLVYLCYVFRLTAGCNKQIHGHLFDNMNRQITRIHLFKTESFDTVQI